MFPYIADIAIVPLSSMPFPWPGFDSVNEDPCPAGNSGIPLSPDNATLELDLSVAATMAAMENANAITRNIFNALESGRFFIVKPIPFLS